MLHRYRNTACGLVALLTLGGLAMSCGEGGNDELPRSRAGRLALMDSDGDGRVSLAEFAAGADRGTSESTGVRFRILDYDSDGFLTVDELGDGDAGETRAKGKDRVERRSALRMRQYDADGDGSVTLEEFDGGYEEEDAGRAMRRFVRLDANSDGVIDPRELRAGWRSGRRASGLSLKPRRKEKR